MQKEVDDLLKSAGVKTLTGIASAIATQQTIVDFYNKTLPAPGDATQTLTARLHAERDTARAYLWSIGKYRKLAGDFQFAADGSVPASGFMTAGKLKEIEETYMAKQDRLTRSGALLNDRYFRDRIDSFRTARDLMRDPRMVDYLKAAAGVSNNGAITPIGLEKLMTSDPHDPNSTLNRFYSGKTQDRDRKERERLIALAGMFNFRPDGTLAKGVPPVKAGMLNELSNRYFSGYDDVGEARDQKRIDRFKQAVDNLDDPGRDGIGDVEDLTNGGAIYDFALKAAGLDSEKVSVRRMEKVLTSDLDDPESFIYTLGDERYVRFAKLFNFDSQGKPAWPRTALSERAINDYARNYITRKTRFAARDDAEKIKSDAREEIEYFRSRMAAIGSIGDFLDDRRMVDVVLTARDIDPSTVTGDYLKKIFGSDLSDPESFANTEPDHRFAEIAASFNIDDDGKLIRTASDAVQDAGGILRTINLYARQTIEIDAGAGK